MKVLVLSLLTAAVFALCLYLRLPGLSAPFHYDEVLRAVPISASPLVDSLIHQQRASISIGFAALSRLSIALGRNNEAWLRLFPWLAGLALPFLGFFSLRLCYGYLAAGTALILFGLSPFYLQSSVQFKPYTIEAAAELIILLMLRSSANRPSLRLFLGILFFTLLSVLVATPIALLVPAVTLCLFLQAKSARSSLRWIALAGGAAVLIAALWHYALILRPQIGEELYVQAAASFPRSYVPGALVSFAWQETLGFFSSLLVPVGALRAFGVPIAYVLLALFCYGTILGMKRKDPGAVLVLVLLITVFGASLCRIWPYGVTRPNFFLYPLITLYTAAGAAALVRLPPRTFLRAGFTFIGVVGIAGMLAPPPYRPAEGLGSHGRWRQLKAGALELRELAQKGDFAVACGRADSPMLRYYMSFYEGGPNEPGSRVELAPDRLCDLGQSNREELRRYLVDHLHPGRKIWIFMGDSWRQRPLEMLESLRGACAQKYEQRKVTLDLLAFGDCSQGRLGSGVSGKPSSP